MAKEKKEIKLTELTAEELKYKLKEAREKLFTLKYSHRTTPLKNPLEIRFIRKEIARIMTAAKAKSGEKAAAVVVAEKK